MTRRPSISLQAAAERLGVHYMTAYRYVRTGRLPATRDGVEWRVDPDQVDRLRTSSRRPAERGSRGRARERLQQRMLAGDVTGAWKVVEDALVSGADPAEIYVEMLVPALRNIGARWATGKITVADEHRASVAAHRIIGQLGPRFARRGRTRGSVIVGAPAGEMHALPSAIVADLLRNAQYDVIDLGANTPPESFVDAARDRARLLAVCLGVTTPGLEEAVRETVHTLHSTVRDVPVIVGGAAIADEVHANRLGADRWSGHDAATLIATVQAAERANQPTRSER
jgi:excisionase family DNA binding protein